MGGESMENGSNEISRRSFLMKSTAAGAAATAFTIIRPELVRGAGNERILRGAPVPVLACPSGHVHAALGSEAEDVLHRHDRSLGDRRERGANEIPCGVFAGRAEVVAKAGPRAVVEGREPAAGGVVVVRARVDDAVGDMVMRQVLAIGLAERELQHLHARKAEDLEEVADLVREDAEVFG